MRRKFIPQGKKKFALERFKLYYEELPFKISFPIKKPRKKN